MFVECGQRSDELKSAQSLGDMPETGLRSAD